MNLLWIILSLIVLSIFQSLLSDGLILGLFALIRIFFHMDEKKWRSFFGGSTFIRVLLIIVPPRLLGERRISRTDPCSCDPPKFSEAIREKFSKK